MRQNFIACVLLISFILTACGGGEESVAATPGSSGAITLSFSGLTAGTKYLGSVTYGGATGMPNPTIVSVNP